MRQLSTTKMKFSSLTLLSLGTAPLLASAQECNRPLLTEAAKRYISAQSLGEPRYLDRAGLSPNTSYFENDKRVTNITSGILGKPLRIDHSRSIHDTINCATYTELIIADPANPYVIGTQIHFSPSTPTNTSASSGAPYANRTTLTTFTPGLEITKIETLITDPINGWLFNAQHTLVYALREPQWHLPVPYPSGSAPGGWTRARRAQIQAAADAYLDLFFKGPGSVPVPFAPECRRLEGGLYTAEGDTCSDGVPTGANLTNRRYVIDETAGTVDVFLNFGVVGGLPDSHEFRVDGQGRITNVHTITVCSMKDCGFENLPEILSEDVGF